MLWPSEGSFKDKRSISNLVLTVASLPKTHQTPQSNLAASRLVENLSVTFSLIDPLLQDLVSRNRLSISHFATTVCQDLVSFDQNDHTNPFRSTIILLGEYDFLRDIILATSAVHVATLRRSRAQPQHHALADALAARGRAYRLLRHALLAENHLIAAPKRTAVVMIAVVFFINFDLIDSGQGAWMPHVAAAGKLVASIEHVRDDIPPFVSRLADLVIADSLTYHILGSALAGAKDADVIGAFERSILLRRCRRPRRIVITAVRRLCLACLRGRVGFVSRMCGRLWRWRRGCADSTSRLEGLLSSYDDLDVRLSVASAHRAAACLYVVLVVPDVLMHVDEQFEPGALVRETLDHLSVVPIEHALAKGIVWPTFLAGAQADDAVSRQWCLQRMQRIWFSTPWICPWGYIESAIVMLQDIWAARDQNDESMDCHGLNWLQELRALKKHCLIV